MCYEYETREVWFKRDELQIYGLLYLPKKAGRLAAFIICHGFGASYLELEKDAVMLAKAGYAALLFDFCGGGGMMSDGAFTEMSIFTEEKDLKAVLAGVKAMEEVDDRQIYLMGESQGGAVAAMVAADCRDAVRGLVLLYPAFNIPDYVRARLEQFGDTPEAYRVLGWNVGKVYAEGVGEYDLYEDARRYDRPTLIIHGDKDELVPIAYAERAAEA
ncbi:MAG: alpha/beta fold hydrolase [Lachnospiraceae bacterium]|nr:alpha/beta fold hydrolase [Lachnospiraceae bacterium]